MAEINLNDVRQTIESRLVVGINSDPPPGVAPIGPGPIEPTPAPVPENNFHIIFNNVSANPPPDTTFVQCLVSFGETEYMTVNGFGRGNNLVGLVVFNISTPAGFGAAANFTLAKSIRDLYNRVTVSNIFFDAPVGPNLVTPSPEGRFQTQVRVAFETFEDF